jgi:hypothetical protein
MPESTPTEIPADLAEIDDETLATMIESLSGDFDALLDGGSRDVAAMTALADDIDRLRGEVVARESAAAEADAAVAALADRVRGPQAETDTEPEPEAETETEEVEAPAEAPAESRQLVTAAAARPVARTAAARPSLGDVARRAPRPRPQERKPQVSITAAADLPGLSPGSVIDLDQVALSMHDRVRNLPMGQRAPVARVQVPHSHTLGVDPMENMRLVDDLVGTPDAAALVAAGGWCAPSQPIFDLFDIGPDTHSIFDLPTLGASIRAGVMLPSFFGIGDAADALWTWTEADDIAALAPDGPTKPCLRIPCPTFTECVMEAEGLCVTHGNLSDRAWPELTRQFLSIVMGAHQRRLSAAKIAKVLADSANVVPDASMLVSDAAADLLGVIELAAADMRSQFRVARTRSVDVLLPDWANSVLRSNMAMRAGVDMVNISDAQVTGWLTARGVRPQFTPDWQPLYNAAPATRWPANITFAIWFSGSYISLDGGVLDLGVVRDSTLNATNDFTAAWSEQFYQVCRRGPQARRYTLPLVVDGVTACCPVVAAP